MPPLELTIPALAYLSGWLGFRLGRKACEAERRMLYTVIQSLTGDELEAASFADQQREAAPWQ